MNQKNIEQLANRILQAEKILNPPIKSEVLAESYFGLDFDCGKLGNDKLAGLKVAEKKIYMNESRADEFNVNFGLKNFTIAHELGHWVLHKDLIGEHTPQMEREADKFATYLLMPEKMIREEFAKINPSFTWSDVYLMSEKFCVSVTAMKIRLSQRELKLIYVDFNSGKCYRSKEEFLEKEGGQIKLF
ncbi:MAG: ImmA/IrrE family metallo-endopeptidase [Quinella sp. 1Q5]|nr:ImmA/IrrE family metallo-endopeptidase [Quinella sp. 1Q5]